MPFLSKFRNLPIQAKLTVLMLLVSGTGLTLAGITLIGYTWTGSRDNAREDIETMARIVADNTAAALVFGDAAAGRETLSALRQKPEVVLACLYKLKPGEGLQLLASHATAVKQSCDQQIKPGGGTVTKGNTMVTTVPVTLSDEHLGWLRLTQSLAPLQAEVAVQIAITLAIIGASFAITFLMAGATQRLVSQPIRDLAITAQQVSETRDYELRAKESGNQDEIGQLVGDFNHMLEQIRQRDAELRKARDTWAEEAEAKSRSNRELQRTLQELSDTQELVRATVESAVDGIIVIDGRGILQTFNPAAESMFGYASSDVIGHNIKMLMPPPYTDEHDSYLRNYLTTGVKKIIGAGREVTGRRKDGSVFPMDLAVSEMKIGDERWFVGMVRDISERKAQEEELHRLNESLGTQVTETRSALERLKQAQTQLVQSEKMASLGALVAGVAHEINTPVGVGVTASSTLHNRAQELRRLYESNKLRRSDLERFVNTAEESATMILRNLQRASELIHSFKQVAVDQSSGERRNLDLKSYIEDVLASLGPKLRRSGHAVAINCPHSIMIETYPGALAQVVTNFVTNSLLHAYDDNQSGNITIDLRHDDSQVTIVYRDDGRGIPEKNLARIFDPFFTTRRGSGGSGLGMHIVYNLVTQVLGGTIEANSEPGQGTEFIVKFPATAQKEAA